VGAFTTCLTGKEINALSRNNRIPMLEYFLVVGSFQSDIDWCWNQQ